MADVTFQFHIVLNSQGTISGPELIQQIEDGVNEIGRLAAQAEGESSSAVLTATQAMQIAGEAKSTANNALTSAQSTAERVETLGVVVNGYDWKITSAVNTANQASTVATEAKNSANSSKEAAETAQQNAYNASQSARTASNEATESKNEAESAKTAAESSKTAAEQAQSAAESAKLAATEAAQSAAQSSAATNLVHVTELTLQVSSSLTTDDLTPSNTKANDLIIDPNGNVFQVASVDGTNITLSDLLITLPNSFVSYINEQSLSDDQKTVAMGNIGLTGLLEDLVTANGGTIAPAT